MYITFADECEIRNSLTLCLYFPLFLSSLRFHNRSFVSNIRFCFQFIFFLYVTWCGSVGVMWHYFFVYIGVANRIFGRLVLVLSFFSLFYSFFNICFILCFDMCMTCCLSRTSMFKSSILVSSLFIYEIIKKDQNCTLFYLDFCVCSVHKVRVGVGSIPGFKDRMLMLDRLVVETEMIVSCARR